MQSDQFERPNYFVGKLLSVEDLRREQDYRRNKARLHNRFLHGWGVVQGLRVSLGEGTVVVSPGLALDCCGNELVLPCEESVTLAGVVGRHWLCVRYVEVPVGKVPALTGDAEPSLFREAVVLELSPTNPMAGHITRRKQRIGCGESHGLPLAVVSRRATRWNVVPVRSSVLPCE